MYKYWCHSCRFPVFYFLSGEYGAYSSNELLCRRSTQTRRQIVAFFPLIKYTQKKNDNLITENAWRKQRRRRRVLRPKRNCSTLGRRRNGSKAFSDISVYDNRGNTICTTVARRVVAKKKNKTRDFCRIGLAVLRGGFHGQPRVEYRPDTAG